MLQVSQRTADVVIRQMEEIGVGAERRVIPQTMNGNEINNEAYNAVFDSLNELKDKVNKTYTLRKKVLQSTFFGASACHK